MSTPARRDLLGIRGMQKAEVEALISQAASHKRARREGPSPARPLAGKVVANLFFEDSTRTRSSFEIAARALGAAVLNWSAKGSSVAKGETLLDSVRTIDAMRPGAIVLRHASSGAAALVARHVRAPVLNGGDGTHEHPTQALADALTLTEKVGSLAGKTVVIAGDILHSRVARSNLHCLRLLGARVVLCGPVTLMPKGIETLGAEVSYDFDRALEAADAVMMLRVQLERMAHAFFPSAREYARRYGMNAHRASRLKPGVPILHPGPMNRGVEITNDVADGPQSAVLDQVENGVVVRMAVLERVCA